jgi:phospholipid/cholesterol/gamma-HCH transport system ATP-binding protein
MSTQMRDEADAGPLSPQPEGNGPLLEVQGLVKRFESQTVLNGIDLAVPRGSVFAVLGKSGTGKSVLLKCMAGIIPPTAGDIYFDGRCVHCEEQQGRAELRRRCSYLFQQNALFDSLSALENVALPLEQTTDLEEAEIEHRSMEALRQLELETFRDRFPGQMSGGMQKRLALARALVTRPELVLFDEPTAGLDPVRRNSVFEMIARFQRQFGFTAVVVTHDVPEALVTVDHVALLDHGRVHFQGSPLKFIESADPVVASFRDSIGALREAIEDARAGKPSRNLDGT